MRPRTILQFSIHSSPISRITKAIVLHTQDATCEIWFPVIAIAVLIPVTGSYSVRSGLRKYSTAVRSPLSRCPKRYAPRKTVRRRIRVYSFRELYYSIQESLSSSRQALNDNSIIEVGRLAWWCRHSVNNHQVLGSIPAEFHLYFRKRWGLRLTRAVSEKIWYTG